MPDATEAQVRARTGAMGFAKGKMDTPARDLSGGEKARLLLGLATFAGAHLLILDEPTNHLDIDSREALVQALADYSGAVILISHDRHLIEASADRLWLVADGTVTPYDDDIDDYRRLVLERPGSSGATAVAPARETAARTGERPARTSARQSAPLRKEIKETEALIEKLQKELQAIDRKLGDPRRSIGDPAQGGAPSPRRGRRRDEVDRDAAEERVARPLSAEPRASAVDRRPGKARLHAPQAFRSQRPRSDCCQ